MPQHLRETGLGALAERWLGAMTAHDLEAAVACFAPDHRHEAPARRGQLVHGNQPVPKEIAELFQSIPDVRAELVRTVTGDDSVRLEWRPHGTRMELAGVNILGCERIGSSGAAFTPNWYETPVASPRRSSA